MLYLTRLRRWVAPISIGVFLLAGVVIVQPAAAITQIPDPNPDPGSYGLEATKTQPAPTQGATITTPGNGASYSTSPTTVNGICPAGLLVEIYDNGVMAGSTMCNSGSFSMQVSLFSGSNALTASVYDSLNQSGPVSATTTVNYTNTQFTAFGQLVTLTSSYGRRSAAAGAELDWPLQLSGGTSPYAFSVDWGDGSTAQLKSQSLAGVVTISHTYQKAGIYEANVRATDANGVSAFLQVVAVANGQVTGAASGSGSSSSSSSKNAATPVTKVVWIPAAIAVILLLPAYWLGRRSQLVSLQNKMLKDRDTYEKEQKK